jgi:Protein of unknown function (DUF1573)
MKNKKIASVIGVFLVCVIPVLAQKVPDLSQFLPKMTHEQKLVLLEFMRTQIAPDPIDSEALALFEKLDSEGRRNALNFIFKTQNEAGQPIRTDVEILRDSIDFGVVVRGSVILDSIVIKNIGENPYIISETMSNCGCTIAEKPDFPIFPGDSVVIHLTFDTRNLLPGPLKRAISIRDNSIPNLRNLIWISAQIISSDLKKGK